MPNRRGGRMVLLRSCGASCFAKASKDKSQDGVHFPGRPLTFNDQTGIEAR
jgi:hypothetical protein